MFDFSGKKALVVGGAGYLCEPICQALARRGAAVAITDLDEQKAQNLAARIHEETNAQTLGFHLDAGSEDSIMSGIRRTVESLGGLDILINAAYRGSHGKNVETLEPGEFDSAAHVALTGAFLLAREAARHMQSGGNIIMFSSMYGRIAPEPGIYHEPMQPNPIDYGVTKAGIDQMVRYLAVHYAPRNIRINGVAPGAFPHAVAIGFGEPRFESFLERLAKKAPMGRIGRQEELVGPVVFLASDEASFVTGQILAVDGGWTIW